MITEGMRPSASRFAHTRSRSSDCAAGACLTSPGVGGFFHLLSARVNSPLRSITESISLDWSR